MTFDQMIGDFGLPVSAQAGDHLFRQGEPDSHFYIVRTGLLKAYYLSGEGKENIKSFLLPGDNIGSLAAMHADAGCTFSLMCLADSKLIKVRFDAVFEAAKRDPEIGALIQAFLINFAMKKEQREYELLCLSAEDRYRRLIDQRPELLDMVQQGDIALYLGITPVGLSRIKKRVA